MTWIFAYGSLMGDNAMRYYSGGGARLNGYRRAFNHASIRRWGTPEHPCPILGLSPGGDCHGVAFDIPQPDERDVRRKIERREGQEEFERKRVQIERNGDGTTKAMVWVTKRRVVGRGLWPEDTAELVPFFRAAHGSVGNGVEYIRTLIHAMERWQIHDAMVESLWEALKPYSNPKG